MIAAEANAKAAQLLTLPLALVPCVPGDTTNSVVYRQGRRGGRASVLALKNYAFSEVMFDVRSVFPM